MAVAVRRRGATRAPAAPPPRGPRAEPGQSGSQSTARRGAQQRGPALDDGGAQLVVLTKIRVHDAAAAGARRRWRPRRARVAAAAARLGRVGGRATGAGAAGVGSAAAQLGEERTVAGGRVRRRQQQ